MSEFHAGIVDPPRAARQSERAGRIPNRNVVMSWRSDGRNDRSLHPQPKSASRALKRRTASTYSPQRAANLNTRYRNRAERTDRHLELDRASGQQGEAPSENCSLQTFGAGHLER